MLPHRAAASALLHGSGLEVGALHEPFPLGPGCRVQYFDAMDEHAARELFPEVPADAFVHVDHVGNLDADGLHRFRDGEFDFVIINHVIEHLANPLRVIEEVFRVLAPGGLAVIAVPDKRFTFDSPRQLTDWPHLWSDYRNRLTASPDDHYEDFLRAVAPQVLEIPENIPLHVNRARSRREHSHVWTSETFREHLHRALAAFSIPAELVQESIGDDNQIEYFSIWKKKPASR